MPQAPTARLGLQALAGSDPINRIDEITQAAFTLLDSEAAIIAWGLTANCPAAGIKGRFYFCEDTGRMLYDTGSQWEVMGGPSAYAARIHRGVAASLPRDWSVLPLDAVTYDPDGCIVNYSYVAPVSGIYAFSGQVAANPQSTSFTIAAGVYKNGSLLTVGSSVTSSGLLYSTVSDTAMLTAGDVLQLAIFTTTALSLNVQSYLNYLSVYKLAQ